MPSISEPFNCRVCGLRQHTPPWGEDGKTPTFEICECCNVEFGYEDGTEESVRSFRQKWLESGGNWTSKNRPPNWSREEQMAGIPLSFRDAEELEGSASRMISRYSTVELVEDLPSGEAMAGSVAVVIEVHSAPNTAYEIEIVDEDGVTRFIGSVAREMVKEISLGSDDERPMVVTTEEE